MASATSNAIAEISFPYFINLSPSALLQQRHRSADQYVGFHVFSLVVFSAPSVQPEPRGGEVIWQAES
jgi:hypothetical protein